MKTLTAFALIFTSAAILTLAWPATAIDEEAVSDDPVASNVSEQPCCPAKVTVSTKPGSCSEGCCMAGETTKADCSLCAKETVVTSDDTVANTTSPLTTGSAEQCTEGDAAKCGGKCVLDTTIAITSKTDAQKCSACPDKDRNEDCAQCPIEKSSKLKSAAKKCEFCTGEECKEECSSCAAAKQETAAADGDSEAAKAPGPGMGRGPGMGHGQGMGRGHSGDSQHAKDHQDFFFLIEHREAIRRTVKNLPNGFESLTESDDPDVAQMIQVHVSAMYDRVENGNPIRMRDPIFRAIFGNTDQIKMKVESTDHGVRVTETSTDPYVVKVLQEHARVVSLWMKNGFAELPKNHAAPKR